MPITSLSRRSYTGHMDSRIYSLWLEAHPEDDVDEVPYRCHTGPYDLPLEVSHHESPKPEFDKTNLSG